MSESLRYGAPSDPAPARTPSAGVLASMERLGWRIEKPLGKGRWAQVYLARPSRRSNEGACQYAVKISPEGAARTSISVRMLANEARVAGEVTSPYVVPILDARLERPPFFTVMPFLPGRTLAEVLRDSGPLEPDFAVWIARQLAEGLASLHEAGWLHLDLKPANIMLTPPGHAVLLDLGFCRRRGQALDKSTEFCTPAYAAPELVGRDGPVEQSDLYSLGIVLYEMLVGSPPFQADSWPELARLHRERRPTDIRAQRPELGRDLCGLSQSLLAKESFRRPDSARDVARRLASMEIAYLADTVRGWPTRPLPAMVRAGHVGHRPIGSPGRSTPASTARIGG
jgi:serine/threonine protein kinase